MLTVGSYPRIDRNVTTLNWIGARPARAIETALGYGAGRLSSGYWILVLKEPLTSDDFEFNGTTMRSDGRLGLPSSNIADDRLRLRVHDQVLGERGKDGYRLMRQQALASISITGERRIAKVIPVTTHDPSAMPDV